MSTSVATPPALAPKSSEVSFTFGGSRPESSETTLPYKGPYRIDTVCGGDCVMVCGVADWRGSEVDPSTWYNRGCCFWGRPCKAGPTQNLKWAPYVVLQVLRTRWCCWWPFLTLVLHRLPVW